MFGTKKYSRLTDVKWLGTAFVKNSLLTSRDDWQKKNNENKFLKKSHMDPSFWRKLYIHIYIVKIFKKLNLYAEYDC